MTINGVEIFDTEITVNSLSDKLTLINSFAAETGVTASAFFSKSFTISDADLAIGDTMEINGTDVTLTATVADLVAKINAKTAQTGISASADGANVTLEGENVQTVSIRYKNEAEIEAGFTSTTTQDSAAINKQGGTTANTSDGQSSTIVLAAGDVVEGRTYRLEITKGANSTAASNIDVSYTAVSGDDNQKVLMGLRDEIIRNHTQLLGGRTSTIDVTGTPGSMIFSASLDYGVSTFDFGIDERPSTSPLTTQ